MTVTPMLIALVQALAPAAAAASADCAITFARHGGTVEVTARISAPPGTQGQYRFTVITRTGGNRAESHQAGAFRIPADGTAVTAARASVAAAPDTRLESALTATAGDETVDCTAKL